MVSLRAGLIVLLLVAAAFVALLLPAASPVLRRRVERAVARMLCRGLLALLGVHVRVVGDVASAGGARLVVANHVSWIDVLVLGSAEPLCFLAKREVAAWPLVGRLAQAQGAVYVDRRRRRSIPAANGAMAKRLAAGRSVLLFPEGTTHDGHRRGRFHTSHLACLRDLLAREPGRPAARVQSVALVYSDGAAAWTGDATLLPHLWAILKRPPITCDLLYGPTMPIARGTDRKALGRALAAIVDGLIEARAAAVAPAGLPLRAPYFEMGGTPAGTGRVGNSTWSSAHQRTMTSSTSTSTHTIRR